MSYSEGGRVMDQTWKEWRPEMAFIVLEEALECSTTTMPYLQLQRQLHQYEPALRRMWFCQSGGRVPKSFYTQSRASLSITKTPC